MHMYMCMYVCVYIYIYIYIAKTDRAGKQHVREMSRGNESETIMNSY